jgi:hypothetical protein
MQSIFKHDYILISFIDVRSSSTEEITTTTISKASPTTSGFPLYNCNDRDQRDVEWTGEPWELVQKNCDEGIFTEEKFTNGKI